MTELHPPAAQPQFRAAAEVADLEQLDLLLDDAENWLRGTALLPDETARKRLQRLIAEARTRRAQVLSPLQIAIVGGTGVGKSTLLNALAGATISRTGEIRPTTQTVTVYHHAANTLGLDPDLAPAAQRVAHERDGLRDKVLIDTPDYDSVDLGHRRIMEGVLRRADVVLWVTTPEKYADQLGAQWLRTYATGRQYVFLLNRADEGLDPEVSRDYRARIDAFGLAGAPLYSISARRAYEALEAEEEPPFDFPQLTALLERELDAKRIRAVKEGNLQELVRRVLRYCHEAVPADTAERLQRWREQGERAYDSLRDELTGRLAPLVTGDSRLERHVEYWFGTGFGGPVGGCLGLVYGLRAAFSPLYPRLWEVGDAPRLELAATSDEAEPVAERIFAAQSRLRATATDLGLPGGAERLAEPDSSLAQSLAQRFDDRLRTLLGKQIRAAREVASTPQRLFSLLLNVPTIIVLLGLPAYYVYHHGAALVQRDVGALALPLGEVTLIALALWLAACTWLAQLAVRRRTRGFVARLGNGVSLAVDEAFRHLIVGRLEERLRELGADLECLQRLAARAESPKE